MATFAADLMVTACAPTEERVEAGLRDSGFAPTVAHCMTQRLAAGLSSTQMLQLTALRPVRQVDLLGSTLEEYTWRTNIRDNPEIRHVVTTAASVCDAHNR